MILTYMLLALAAAMNAIMDRTENIVAFNRSIFSHADKKFWCKEISWQYAAKVFGWKADAWHISKSAMVILFACVAVFFESSGKWWLDILLIGTVWNATFNLFYHKILYR